MECLTSSCHERRRSSGLAAEEEEDDEVDDEEGGRGGAEERRRRRTNEPLLRERERALEAMTVLLSAWRDKQYRKLETRCFEASCLNTRRVCNGLGVETGPE